MPLGVYRLSQNSLIDCEIAAYESAFEMLEELIAKILSQSFVQTSEGSGLSKHERLVGLQERPNMSLESRRELIIYRLSTSPFDFTHSGMVNSVRAAGLDAEIIENYAEESLTLISKRLIDEFLELDGVRANVDTMLPAHLIALYDIGIMTWYMFDLWDGRWTEWDSKDFTWAQFDLNGHYIFGGINNA